MVKETPEKQALHVSGEGLLTICQDEVRHSVRQHTAEGE